MSLPGALSAGDLVQLRAQQFFSPVYLLLAPNTVVFRAQINQSAFDASFAEITFDNVTVGSYTAIKEGFTCYISNTTDPRDALFTFRIRKSATNTIVYINQTSASLSDDQYIIVTKDVRESVKLPRLDDDLVQFKDYDIAYRTPKPLIYDLKTAYVVPLNISGNADVPLSPNMLPVAFGAGIDSWLWDLDGGTFQVGSSTSQNITARYTATGHYMPRVTVTDTNGVANWFSPHVFVVSSNFTSNELYAGISELTIDHNLSTGRTAQITLQQDLSDVLDYTFACIYAPGNKTEINDAIQFVGRWPNESSVTEIDQNAYQVTGTNFDLDGLSNIMGRMISRNIPMRYEDSPNEWDELKNLTVWRAIAYYLVEHTTIPNCHALTFDDTGLDYRTTNYTAGDSNVLDTLQSILQTINGAIAYSAQGGVYFAREAVYLSSEDRNALTTIADWGVGDIAITGDRGQGIELARGFLPTVGIAEAWGAIFNTTTKKLQAIQARTPAVVTTEGNERVELNRQVLTANSTLAQGYIELGERIANDFAAQQPTDTLDIAHPPEYRFLIPNASMWYTWTLPATTNERGIAFDTNTRWLLTSLSASYNIDTGFPDITAIYQRETQDTDYQTISNIPRTETPLSKPTQPLIDDYPNLPETPGINSPSGTGFESGQEPPFDENDVGGINDPQDPGTTDENTQSSSGDFGVIWDSNRIWLFEGMLNKTNPDYQDVTPLEMEGFTTITDVKLARTSNYAWALSNNGTDSRLWRTKDFGNLQWTYTQLKGIQTLIRVTLVSLGTNTWLYTLDPDIQTVDPWEHLFNIETISGPASRDITYEDDNFILLTNTTYVGGTGLVHGDTSSGRKIRSVNMQIPFPEANSTTITKITLFYDYVEGSAPGGDTQLRFSAPSTTITFSFDDGKLTEGTGQTTIYEGSITMSPSDLLTIRMNSSLDVFEGSVTLRKVTLEGTGANPFIELGIYAEFSQNNGVSLARKYAGDSNNGETGIDSYNNDPRVYVGALDRIRTAVADGGFGDATLGDTTGGSAFCIREKRGRLFGSSTALSGESLWWIRFGSQDAITLNDGSNQGFVVSQNAIDMTEDYAFVLAEFGGVVKLAITDDDGVSFTFQTGVTSNANYIRVKEPNIIYLTDGAVVKVSIDAGTTLLTRTTPSAALKGIEVK